jgi:hypothetical protein
MQLSQAHKNELYENGFTVVRGAVAPLQIERALRAINHRIGLQMSREMPAGDLGLGATPPITGLFNDSPLSALMRSLLGDDAFEPAIHMQMAIRFPVLADPREEPFPHLDGVGVPVGMYSHSTALIGVHLSPVPHCEMGNFTVWPGSHRLNEQYFRQHGTQVLLRERPPIDLPPPVQVCAQPGDAVICHYLLVHGILQNASPRPRYAGFFRVEHRDLAANCERALTDIWLNWPGMHETVQAARVRA